MGPALSALSYAGDVLSCDDPPRHYQRRCQTKYSRSSAYVPVAMALGFLGKRRVDTEAAVLGSINEIAGPDVAVACLSDVDMVRALVEKIDLTVIATPLVRTTVGVWTLRSGPNTVKDLVGSAVALGKPGSGDYLALRTVAGQAGIQSDRLKAVVTGETARLNSLLRKDVAAALYPAPYTDLLRDDRLQKIAETRVSFALEVIVAPRKAYDDPKNMPFFVGVLAGIADSIKFLTTQDNRRTSIDAIAKHSNVDQGEAEKVYLNAQRISLPLESNGDALQAMLEERSLIDPSVKKDLVKGIVVRAMPK